MLVNVQAKKEPNQDLAIRTSSDARSLGFSCSCSSIMTPWPGVGNAVRRLTDVKQEGERVVIAHREKYVHRRYYA